MLYCILDKSVSGARIAGSLLLLLSPFELGASRNDLAGRYEAACVRESAGGCVDGSVCQDLRPTYGWPLLSVAQQQVLTRSDTVCTYII